MTRLEGHGRIDIFLGEDGRVANAYVRVSELRGFEAFCVGRPVKACDAVYHVDPPPAAKKLRRLLYNTFYVADHAVHFYILSGPDLAVVSHSEGLWRS